MAREEPIRAGPVNYKYCSADYFDAVRLQARLLQAEPTAGASTDCPGGFGKGTPLLANRNCAAPVPPTLSEELAGMMSWVGTAAVTLVIYGDGVQIPCASMKHKATPAPEECS